MNPITAHPGRKRTDNYNEEVKLEIRRYLIKHIIDSGRKLNVFDACQGDRILWTQLEKEFPLESYFGVDTKSQRGRLTIDSSRIIDKLPEETTFIDIDTWGSPVPHLLALCKGKTRYDYVGVALTIGMITRRGAGAIPKEIQYLMGLTDNIRIRMKLQGPLTAKLQKYIYPYILYLPTLHDYDIIDIVEAVPPSRTARYFGMILQDQRKDT